MRTATLERREPAQTSPPPATGIEWLVRRLVEEVEGHGPAAGAARDVILDVIVDGVRCMLTRQPPQHARAAVLLSPREREIARMVARGYPNKTIAGVLEISSWTVGTYLRRVFAKLDVGSRAAMVARLMEEGLLKD
jgi:DNA-binding CsgD family transcriptional regulator